ncbi:MAG: cytochrome c3 family protein [Kofleriaceae bacterium]|nr:cytochrome c3 family protein [Kofleriaceae bacterium]
MTRSAFVLALIALAACAGVLGLTRRAPEAFPHRSHVLAGVSCTRCHANIERDPGTVLHLPDAGTCTTCHAQPHDARPCLDCHVRPGAAGELAEVRAHVRFDHGQHAAATRGNCVRCHLGVSEGDTRLRPPMAACFRCHAHDAARDRRNCDACHVDLEDSRTLPQTHLVHDGNWVRDHGTRAASSGDACQSCHAERFCASCHGQTVPVLPSKLRLGDPFSPSVHRAGFSARHALEARADPGTCTTCHAPDRCASCHLARGVAGLERRSPHPAGWVGLASADNQHGREARRDPAACASCHDGAGQMMCVSCHRVGGVGGSPHPPGWESRQPLTAMPCRLCHPLGAR